MAPIIWVPLRRAIPSFGLQDQRLETDLAQGDQGGHDRATELDLAATDERQREMGQRGEVTRGAEAPLLRHDRMNAGLEEGQQAVHEQRPAAAVPEREGIGPEQQHRPNDLAREGGTHACRVAHQEVLLEALGVLGSDRDHGQVAEPGRHAVHDRPGIDQGLDDVASLLHPLSSGGIEHRGGAVAGDRLDGGDRQVRAGQVDRRRCRPPDTVALGT